jgi:cbb3-type cytochrome oxidase maturation protein
MSVVIILILASLSIGLVFLGAFIWSVRSGQYEDTTTPSLRILADEPPPKISKSKIKSK